MVTNGAYFRSFQFKILNNKLYLNKKSLPVIWKILRYVLFVTFSKKHGSTRPVNDTWPFLSGNNWRNILMKTLDYLHWHHRLPFLGIFDKTSNYIILINHLLRIFQLYIFKLHQKKTLASFLSDERNPTNIPRVFHVEMTWKRSFLRRFNVECMCLFVGKYKKQLLLIIKKRILLFTNAWFLNESNLPVP